MDIEKIIKTLENSKNIKIEIKSVENLNKITNELKNIGDALNKYVKIEFKKLKEILSQLSKILYAYRVTTRGPIYHLPFIPEIGILIKDLEIFIDKEGIYITTKKVEEKFKEGLEYRWFHFYEPRNIFEIYYQKYSQERGYSDLIVFYTYFISSKYPYTIKEINELIKSIMNIKIFRNTLIPQWIKITEKAVNEIKIKFLTDEIIETIVENSLIED